MKFRQCILLTFVILYSSIISAQDINAYLTRAAALKDRSMFSQTIALCSEAINVKKDYRLYTERGGAFLMNGNTEDAINDFKMANNLEPGSGYLGLARAYAINNETEKAVTNLQYHLQSEFKLPRKEILLDAHFSSIEETVNWRQLWKKNWYNQLEEAKAEIEYLVNANKITEARNILSVIENLYKEQAEIMYLKGLIEAGSNNTKVALQYLSKAVSEGKTEYSIWKLYIGQLKQNGDFLSAANACTEAILLYPGKTELIMMKSENLRMAGDRSRAIEAAEMYRELYPGDQAANSG